MNSPHEATPQDAITSPLETTPQEQPEPVPPSPPLVTLTILVRPKMRKYQVVVHDVSPTGIGFLADVELHPGTVLALQRLIYQPGQSWIRSGRVLQATPQSDKWLVGCELSPPFSEEEMAALTP